MGGAIRGCELDAGKGATPSGALHLHQLDPTKGRESSGY